MHETVTLWCFHIYENGKSTLVFGLIAMNLLYSSSHVLHPYIPTADHCWKEVRAPR